MCAYRMCSKCTSASIVRVRDVARTLTWAAWLFTPSAAESEIQLLNYIPPKLHKLCDRLALGMLG